MIFRDFQWFPLVIYYGTIGNLEKSWKIMFSDDFFLYQSQISAGIQKSYLEHRAIILKVRKMQNPSFGASFSGFW